MINEIKETKLSREVIIQKCLKEYKADPKNTSVTGLAKKYKIPRTTLFYHFQLHKVKLPFKNTRFSNKDKQVWKKLYLENKLSPEAISNRQEIKACARTIKVYLEREGLYPRK